MLLRAGAGVVLAAAVIAVMIAPAAAAKDRDGLEM
jgi:hypothetical protein